MEKKTGSVEICFTFAALLRFGFLKTQEKRRAGKQEGLVKNWNSSTEKHLR